jgi:hypothetical protein
LESKAEKYLVDNNLKPKFHPGVYHLKKSSLPTKFVETAQRILSRESFINFGLANIATC